MRRTLRSLGRSDDGFTLVEMLVATTLALIIIGAAVQVFTASLRSEPRERSRAAKIQGARTAIDRITRELRQGSSVPVATSSQLSIVTYVNAATCGGTASTTSIPCRVTYTCTGTVCTRSVASPNGSGGGAAVQFASGLSSPNVFSYSPSAANPSFVGVTLAFPAGNGDDAVTLDDGVALRNRAPA
jgi:prepilin-type N-terminal cleavage/methylation domain-containing protein